MSAERLEQARADLARRRKVAEGALPGPWRLGRGGRSGFEVLSEDDGAVLDRGAGDSDDLVFIAANDPAHVLAVLAAAEATLDRHGRTHTCQSRWLDDDEAAEWNGTIGRYHWPELPCADVKAVFDVYAPVPRFPRTLP